MKANKNTGSPTTKDCVYYWVTPFPGNGTASAVRLNLRARWVTETTAEEDLGTERKG